MKTMVTKIVPFPFILENRKLINPYRWVFTLNTPRNYRKKIDNSTNCTDQYYSFIEITFDTGPYVKPWRHNPTTVHFRVVFFKLWSRSYWRRLWGGGISLIYFTGYITTIKSSPFAFIGRSKREFLKFWYLKYLAVSNSTRETTLF